MDREQLENLYKINDIEDYELKSYKTSGSLTNLLK